MAELLAANCEPRCRKYQDEIDFPKSAIVTAYVLVVLPAFRSCAAPFI